MKTWMVAVLAGAAITTAMPAQAAWKSYIIKELGFSFQAPGDVKASLGTFRSGLAGPRQTQLFRSTEDGIEYRVSVMHFKQAQAEGAAILGEREYMFQDKKKVLMDTFGRVEPGKDAVYGRKMVVDQPGNKGRTTGAFYFTNGKMFALEATVLPANGDYQSPDPGRFIDSITFVLTRAQAGATELKTPAVE